MEWSALGYRTKFLPHFLHYSETKSIGKKSYNEQKYLKLLEQLRTNVACVRKLDFSQTVSQQVRLVSNIRSVSQSLSQISLKASQISQQDQVSLSHFKKNFGIPPFLILSSCSFLFTTDTSLTLIN